MSEKPSRRPPPRLYSEASLSAGEPMVLTMAQAHYLRSVLRLNEGAPVVVFNGRDGEWLAYLEVARGSGGWLRPEVQTRPQSGGGGPWLLFAPLKKDATDFVVEKAVELGVGRLCPVMTRRTQTQTVRVDRLRAQAVEAAEQCERLDVPEVEAARPLPEVLAQWPAGRHLCILGERRQGVEARAAFEALRGQPVAFLVGPEGGLDDRDLDGAAQLASCTVDLGPRILRAETAAAAVLAVWQAVAGDWGPLSPAPLASF
ncbi:16S rRNA (uracil(1498)-N(3))-methyltransferase [Pararhodospirillum photometricum]|uniref:Ribosomal RNA small subunit methyltransferase E n=1 Tax=Pararhodospirillum photometricum DSM 122 TaxID=1150469 RepID=H6SNR6_PARPM|nr:16S rRNA (uracil(1498)-N(3))-methyltransferase [Pararhodospirillum photometricum]CCG09397.1 Putative uncharacterized protein [Pararhodospirillum photometricum DSM 122]